jgi:hypothetical protein
VRPSTQWQWPDPEYGFGRLNAYKASALTNLQEQRRSGAAIRSRTGEKLLCSCSCCFTAQATPRTDRLSPQEVFIVNVPLSTKGIKSVSLDPEASPHQLIRDCQGVRQ